MPKTNLFFAPAIAHKPAQSERSIGEILIESGRLQPGDDARILQLQQKEGLRFGAAGIKLRLLSKADVEFALSQQFDHPSLSPGESDVDLRVVAAYRPYNSHVEALRALRTQLLLHWFDSEAARRALAIVSADQKEGRSFIAANMAVVFSQLGQRTLLIDADMRNPQQHRLFGVQNRSGLSAALSGRGGTELAQPIRGLHSLFVLPAGAEPPNPLELLARPLFQKLLDDASEQYEIILVDTPPAALYADAQTVATRTGGVLLVARTNVSRIVRLRSVCDATARAGVKIVGTVLNDA